MDEAIWMSAADIWIQSEPDTFAVNNDPLNSFTPVQDATSNATSLSIGPRLASLITFPEVMMDVSKWVAYDLLLPSSATEPELVVFEVAKCGALAGVIGNLFFEVLKGNEFNKTSLVRFTKSGLEGAALFVAYQEATSFICANQDMRKVLSSKLPFFPYVE